MAHGSYGNYENYWTYFDIKCENCPFKTKIEVIDKMGEEDIIKRIIKSTCEKCHKKYEENCVDWSSSKLMHPSRVHCAIPILFTT